MNDRHYTVYPVPSIDGQVILAQQGLTTELLEKALELYQAEASTRVATWIGVHPRDGFVFSTDADWRPDKPDAFAAPLGLIPWVHIHELLGKLPEGTTQEWLDAKSQGNEPH